MILALPENPTTGYRWILTLPEGLRMEDDSFSPPHSGIGSGGTHTWQITAETPGTFSVIAVYKRPWEADSGREKTFRFVITAR